MQMNEHIEQEIIISMSCLWKTNTRGKTREIDRSQACSQFKGQVIQIFEKSLNIKT